MKHFYCVCRSYFFNTSRIFINKSSGVELPTSMCWALDWVPNTGKNYKQINKSAPG